MKWELRIATQHTNKPSPWLEECLAEGWEPFAVTDGPFGAFNYHLKRRVYVAAVPKERLCWSRGPRIGENGVPYCKQPEGHDGPHFPPPEDGWEHNLSWGKPDMCESWRNA